MELVYWHWIVLGIVLMLAEIFIGSFFIFWFGAAAVVVGLSLTIAPSISAPTQLIYWTLLSLVFAVAWFRFLKPLSKDVTKAGLSREALIGEIGQVLSVPNGDKRGMVRFPAPLLGSDEWLIMSQDSLSIGDRVSVKDVSGNSLIVVRV
ncbi:MAG: NfeD family protein [OM182 bacterium]|jgi:inner membrane protein|nr:NfeD family protein [OM182 bacterium]MDP4768815.1 NfeD family protein [OM182 bacterium]